MNYFDIRKLQASLSMIRVALLKSNANLGDFDIQAYLANMPSSVLSPESFSEDLSLENLMHLADASLMNEKLDDIKLDIKKILVESIRSVFANTAIETQSEVQKPLVYVRPRGSMVANIGGIDISYDEIISKVFGALHAEFTDNEYVVPIRFADIVVLAWQSLYAETPEILTGIVLEDFVAMAVKSLAAGSKFATIIQCPEIDTDVYKSAHVEGDELPNIINFSSSVAAAVSSFTINNKEIKTKFVTLDNLIADAVEAFALQQKDIILSATTKVMSQLAKSSQLITAIDLAFSERDTLETSVALGLLSQVGLSGGFSIGASSSQTNELELNPINIPKLMSQISLAYDLPASMQSGIDFAVKILAKAEVQEKESIPIIPPLFRGGSTICVFVDDFKAVTLIATLKTIFGAQAKVYAANASVHAIGDTDVDMDVNAQVAAFSSKILNGILNINTQVGARLGLNIIKTLRDYNALSLRSLSESALENLYMEFK